MKTLLAALVAGAFAFSSVPALAADAAGTDPTQTETKPQKAKKTVKRKAKRAKEKTAEVAGNTQEKVKSAVRNRKTTDPSSPNESNPSATK